MTPDMPVLVNFYFSLKITGEILSLQRRSFRLESRREEIHKHSKETLLYSWEKF